MRSLEEHPLKELATFYEARQDLLRGHPRTAFAECDQYLEQYPEGRHNDECLLIQAEAHLALGNRRRAVERFDAYLEEHPKDQRREAIALKVALALESSGRVKEAVRRYEALYMRHDLPTTGAEARRSLERLRAKGLDFPPLSDEELYTRACSLRDSGEVEASFELFCDLELRNPAEGSGANALGERLEGERHDFLWKNRRYEELAVWYERKYQADPEGAAAAENLYWAVQGFTRCGRFTDAVRFQELGRRSFPGHRRFRESFERSALLYVGAGQYDRALTAYQDWQKASYRARRSSRIRFRVGYYAYRSGKLGLASDKLSNLAEGRSGYKTAARFFLGKALVGQGKAEAGKAAFERVLQDAPDSWYAQVVRSRRRQAEGQGQARTGRWPGRAARSQGARNLPPPPPLLELATRLHANFVRGTDAPLDPVLARVKRDEDGRIVEDGGGGWARVLPFPVEDDAAAESGDSRAGEVRHRAESSSEASGLPPDGFAWFDPTIPPSTWIPSPWWQPDDGHRLWKQFVDEQSPHWPQLEEAYELSRIGLGDLAGPLLAAIYKEVRELRRSRSKKRKVQRYRSSGRRVGGPAVARWASILDLRLKDEDWLQLFAAAGHPASVAYFAKKSIDYDSMDRATAVDRAAWSLRYPAAFAPHVWQAAWENDVDPLLMLSIMRAESLFRHDAVSRVGALGLVQVMPATGARVASLMQLKDFRVERLLEPRINVGVGTWYLGKLLDRFDGQFPLAVGSYNGGPHNIGRWLREKVGIPLEDYVEEIAFNETRNYVKKVVQYYAIYTALYTESDYVQLSPQTEPDDASVIDF